jgi:hypothetical protein
MGKYDTLRSQFFPQFDNFPDRSNIYDIDGVCIQHDPLHWYLCNDDDFRMLSTCF